MVTGYALIGDAEVDVCAAAESDRVVDADHLTHAEPSEHKEVGAISALGSCSPNGSGDHRIGDIVPSRHIVVSVIVTVTVIVIVCHEFSRRR